MSEFMQPNRRRIQTANKKGTLQTFNCHLDSFGTPFENKRPYMSGVMMHGNGHIQHVESTHSKPNLPVKQIRTANKPKSATGYRIN